MNETSQHQNTFTPDLPGLEIDRMIVFEQQVIIYAHGTATEMCCPDCELPSTRIHSHYTRCPQDLPLSGKQARLHIRLKRFRCDNRLCNRRTFVEALPELVAFGSQRTQRCSLIQRLLGLALGGECGARVLCQLGLPVSEDTVLRLVRRMPTPEFPEPRFLGIDDWAWRKGTRYGTVLCDLERHQIIDILPDRKHNTLKAWLRQHPDIELITRDRNKTYREAATHAAPQAQQVADRWHLLKNLRDKLQIQLRLYKKMLHWLPTLPPADPNSQPLRIDTPFEQQRIENHQRRVAQHEQILQWYHDGYDVHKIALLLGVSSRTVYRWLAKSVIPERRRYLKRETQIAPFAAYVQQRWEEGCRSARDLHRELQSMGFTGNHQTVDTALDRLGRGLSVLRTPPPKPPNAKRLTPAKAVWLFVLPAEKLNAEHQDALAHILQHPILADLYDLAQRFCTLVRQRQANELDTWMADALHSEFSELVSFVNGLHQDLDAVRAALTSEWSNGPVEGHVNRLKLVKRQMYGRAGFDLLRARLLHPV